MAIPTRKLGKTGADVTILGLGGEGILRTRGYEPQAYELINRAIDLGLNYFESARAYDGSESYYGKSLKERRSRVFLTSKSHARSKEGALAHLQQTLANMKTDHLDLWQIHDVREEHEIAEIFGPGGALEAFTEAKEKGLVRFIGVTGHHSPSILRKCIELFEFDTVLLPVNAAEPAAMSFIQEVVPVAARKSMGIIGMKVYFRGLAAQIPDAETLNPFYRFALSQQISTAVIGCDNIHQLEENAAYAELFEPLSADEQQQLINTVAPYARQLMYYKAF
ncbi:MAG TPA: aldo/keto reductase [Dissulfurispiraceae bacterium]|nr:aldo/keto reductase [Dissulfurispiraceae bacterium]